MTIEQLATLDLAAFVAARRFIPWASDEVPAPARDLYELCAPDHPRGLHLYPGDVWIAELAGGDFELQQGSESYLQRDRADLEALLHADTIHEARLIVAAELV